MKDTVLPLKLRYLDFPVEIYEQLLDRKNSCDDLLAQIPTVGCFGQTLCAIAEGSHNLFMFDGTRGGLWDVIPGEVILREMGCMITDYKRVYYN